MKFGKGGVVFGGGTKLIRGGVAVSGGGGGAFLALFGFADSGGVFGTRLTGRVASGRAVYVPGLATGSGGVIGTGLLAE